MREVIRSVLIARPGAAVYEIINDVERYPEFVPGCSGARIESRGGGEIIATLGVRKGPLAMEFTTRNRLTPSSAIDIQLLRGPFQMLSGGWQILALGEQGCRATLTLRFAFANPVTALVLEPAFEKILADLVDAFVLRARQLPASN